MSILSESELSGYLDDEFPIPAAKRRRVSREPSEDSEDRENGRQNERSIPAGSTYEAPTRITKHQTKEELGKGTEDSPPGPVNASVYTPPTLTSTTFSALNVHPWLTHTLTSLQIHHPTRIQQTCIPAILSGHDVIGGSRTGTGKTLAFAVPILQKWAEDPFGIYALVLTPTRELALQIYEQFVALGANQGLKVVLITGGTEMRPQASALERRPHIVVATPGRLADHVERSGEDTIHGLRRTKVVVFDEADRLLSSSAGMLPDINTCLSALPPANERLTLLFTATVTPEVRSLKDIPRPPNKPPIFISEVTDTTLTPSPDSTSLLPPSLSQTYIQTPPHQAHKEAYLLILLMYLLSTTSSQIIIFTNRTITANHLHYTLTHLFTQSATIEDFLTTHNKANPSNKLSLSAKTLTALHSDLPQKDRARNLSAFRAQTARILICTDLVSRGLDVPGVGYVINMDMPRDPVDYVHRVGRTARAGRGGAAVCLVGPRDVDLVLAVEQYVGGDKMEAWEAPGVNIESRVVRGRVLKDVGEARLEALREIGAGKVLGGGGYRKKMKKDRKRAQP